MAGAVLREGRDRFDENCPPKPCEDRMSDLIPAWVDGQLVLRDKIEVHALGLRHPAVSVFVMQGSRTLLQRRAQGKYHTPGLWTNSCCTHPRWGEDAAKCAARRLTEELGIEALPLSHRDRIEYRAAVGGGLVEHEMVDIFLAEAPPGLRLAPNPEEVMDVRWVTLDALATEVAEGPERFTPWLRAYLDHDAAAIFDMPPRG